MDCIIETSRLAKSYGSKLAVDNVSIHVNRGDIYGLIGKNGAGKTTLMKLILGLTFADSGNIRLFGSDKLDAERAHIGSLIEAPGLYNDLTAYGNMKKFAQLTGGSDEEINSILALVGLKDTGNKKAGAFSLGMRQRLGIGIALLGNPDLLVLDEPINGLDPAGIKEVRDTLLELNRKGVTILISSHLLDELGKIATKFGIMRAGALVEELTRDEISAMCRTPLEIKVSDIARAKEFIEANFSGVQAEIVSNALHIHSELMNPAVLNRALVNEGIDVFELKRESVVFEDFFIRRLA